MSKKLSDELNAAFGDTAKFHELVDSNWPAINRALRCQVITAPPERPEINVNRLDHKSDCGVHDLTYDEDATESDCTCGAVIRWYEAVLQAIFDPENQPSQFGTSIS